MTESFLMRYKILAFIVWHKNRRASGVIHSNEKMYLIAKEMGIAPNTYASFRRKCEALGLLKPQGANLQFVSIYSATIVLFQSKNETALQTLKRWKYNKYWRFNPRNPQSYKDFYNQIRFSVVESNYAQQAYCQKREKVLTRNSFRNKAVKSPNKSLRGENLIKSGKFHVANLLGCGSSTATHLLGVWHKDKLISRTIQRERYYFSATHTVKDLGLVPKNAFWSKNGFWEVIHGSRIDLYPESYSFNYERGKDQGRITAPKLGVGS